MKRYMLIFALMILPTFASAESKNAKKSDATELIMTGPRAIQLAGDLVERGDFENAETILTGLPNLRNLPLEIERWFLLGQIASRRGDYDTAIKIFRKILDEQPDLARIRFELAVCYMHMKQWYRADYHLRLAMAGADLSDDVKRMMNYYRYIVRQNKNWHLWFNFGAAPDNNINQTAGGEECITTIFGPLCRQLPKPVAAIGYNVSLGGNYEFKLSDHWRWKNDATVYTNVYDLHDYDDLYLSVGSGPRYVWKNGDIWLAGIGARRWYGWNAYNWTYGAKADINYDFTRRVSGGLSLRFTDNIYDEFGEYMDGQSYSIGPRLSWSIDATKYLMFRAGLDREVARDDIYSNWRPSVGVGFGAELPWGFHVYLEPYFSWANYDGARWVVHDNKLAEMRERDFIQRYALSMSNNKLSIWGFVPTITVSYTKRDSNIRNREYDKTTIEFGMQQRF